MQLREIQISGFGTFADTRVRGLVPGLNVLHGPNEFGKTTLLEFVRRVLFGFPAKRGDTNPYPALRGGQYGGQIVCQMRDGRTLTVSRTSGKSGGSLTVEDDSGDTVNTDSFYAALGTTSSDLYHNVFSVGLEELYRTNVISLPEVKDRVYGAGLGMGEVSVTQLKESFSGAAEKLFKPRGSTQRMNVLAGGLSQLERQIRERAAQLGQYDEKVSERGRLAAESEQLREQQRNLQAEQRTLGNQESLYATFAGLRAAEKELAEVGNVPDIPDEMMDEVAQRRQSVSSLDEKLQETRARLTSKRSEVATLTFDPALLENEKDIKALSRSIAQYRDARRDLPVRTRERELALEQMHRSITELGEGWTEERVRSFTLTTEQDVALRGHKDALRARERAAEKAGDRLDDYRAQTRASRARPALPAVYRIVGLAILGLGVAGCVYTAVHGLVLPAIVSGVAAALGLVVALSLGSSAGPLRDRAIQELENDREEAARQLGEERAAWATFLKSLGLAPSLTPEAAIEHLQALRALQASLREVDKLDARIQGMKAIVETTVVLFAKVAFALAEPVPSADVVSGIEAMDARLDSAQELRARSETLRRELAQLEERDTLLEADLTRARSAFASVLKKYGVATFEEFVALHKRAARVSTLRAEIAKSRLAIQSAAGVGAPYDAFVAALESTSPQEIAARLAIVEGQLADANNQLDSASRHIGGLDVELSDLTSGEQLLDWESEAQRQRQQLREAYHEWLCARIGFEAVERAVSKYETTRQPAVIREAQTVFASMTGGRYVALISPVGSDDLRARDASDNERSVTNELSRGTREQLYLAMRLGLIAQYEQTAEPLPVIMDDILVNFDDMRGPLAVQALAEFAKDRQVIVMTCHESTLSLYRQAGATELALKRESLI